MSSKLDQLIASYHSPDCDFNVDKSIELCKEILKINPNLIEFQENLACEYYRKREYEKSIKLFNECIEKGVNNDDSYLMIALSLDMGNLGDRCVATPEVSGVVISSEVFSYLLDVF